ncbi:MAG: GNAT family N-acetyltransferase [Rhodobacter sp.]|nr:GNAT family N-acetyltransferase [Rhodobacter sp.]
MQNPVLRLIEPEDVDAYRNLYRQALRESADSFEATLEDADAKGSESYALELRQRYGFGCFQGRDLIGMVFFRPSSGGKASHRAALSNFYVDFRYRRQRIAYALLELAKEISKLKKIQQLELLVSSAADRAIEFYTKAGFQQTGCIPNAIKTDGDRHDLLLMVLEIESTG